MGYNSNFGSETHLNSSNAYDKHHKIYTEFSIRDFNVLVSLNLNMILNNGFDDEK